MYTVALLVAIIGVRSVPPACYKKFDVLLPVACFIFARLLTVVKYTLEAAQII
jgi:hypothetical protein